MNVAETEKLNSAPNCFFRRARKPRRSNIRGKRAEEDEDSDDGETRVAGNGDDSENDEGGQEEDESAVVRINRWQQNKRGGIRSSAGSSSSMAAKNKRKRGSGRDADNEDDSGESSDDEDTERRRKERMNAVGVSFEGTGQEQGRSDMGATATNQLDTDISKDYRATEEKARANRESVKNPLEDKTYKGLKSYAKYIEKKETAAGSAGKISATGPQRAPANIRATVRWDYEPAICKDYKETGFCGFGDSCKFMHDRSDYKFGWQLEREMEDGTYGGDDDENYEISSDDEDLPFKCYLCKDSFKDPVVTKCKHYFCEKCALQHYRRSQRCAACGKNTAGVFNPAKEIVKKFNKIKEKDNSGGDSDID